MRNNVVSSSLRRYGPCSSGGARPGTLVLVVEDLHWSDPTTEETLRYLADSVATTRVVLLMTYRPGYHNPFGERTYVSRLVLHTLSTHESAQLAEGMLATSALPRELRDVIMQKAEGNPFFIEEVLASSWRPAPSPRRMVATCSAHPCRTLTCLTPSRA